MTHDRLQSESGQMAVELAVLMPVVVVVALVVYNLARFVALCAVFDRVAPDAVLVHGVCPAGIQTDVVAVDKVRRQIEESLDAAEVCAVYVDASRLREEAGTGLFRLSPSLTRFTCTLSFRPWPSSFVLAGASYDAPPVLTHQKVLVVDRYRSGVVM